MKTQAYIISTMLSMALLSCSPRDQYQGAEFKAYLETVHASALDESLYILVPMNSCDGCRQIVYRNLLSAALQKNITMIFIGEVREALTLNYLTRLRGKGIEIYYDPGEQIRVFDLLEEDYPLSHISLIDVVGLKVVSKLALKPNMINGEVDIRKDIFKNYIR